jgi:hypothetical protein
MEQWLEEYENRAVAEAVGRAVEAVVAAVDAETESENQDTEDMSSSTHERYLAFMEDQETVSITGFRAATPKRAGRCKEGALCNNLRDHSCLDDTASTVTMASVSSRGLKCLGLTRNGEELPKSPPPSGDFTLRDLPQFQDLDKLIRLQDVPVPPKSPSIRSTLPSIVSTDPSIIETDPSIIETDPSIISTNPSIVSTVPSVLILEEVDLRYRCLCGTEMGLQERVATKEFAARYPSPYVCYSCRWARMGL